MEHEQWIRKAIEIAKEAQSKGNHPFGALLVSEAGELLLTAENKVSVPYTDFTAHAETELGMKEGATSSRRRPTSSSTNCPPCVPENELSGAE
jgi:tRNA(Arg) A34 adenosine deaminase TadA